MLWGDFALTLSKIAKLANVSVSTASKAFSMSSEISEETRDIVFEVAKRHGCFKKFFNAKYPKLVIAVICPEFESLYYANILACLQRRLSERNCEVCVATTSFSKDKAKELFGYYSKYARVDGIILIDCSSALEIESDVPTVCIGHTRGNVPGIFSDTKEALSEAIDYFLSKGVSDIGFLGDYYTTSKMQSFCEIMTKRCGGYNSEKIVSGNRFSDGGYETAKSLVEAGKVPRALICAYDYLAIGAMRAFAEAKIRVPEDVAIIGFDDIAEARFLTPPLSSISANVEEICEIAAKNLLCLLMEKEYDMRTAIKATLNLRASSEIK